MRQKSKFFLTATFSSLLVGIFLYFIWSKKTFDRLTQQPPLEKSLNGFKENIPSLLTSPNLNVQACSSNEKHLCDLHGIVSSFRGKVGILNFWASWCQPCLEEMPALLELSKKRGIDLLLVSVDDDWTKAREFLDRMPIHEHVKIFWDQEKKFSAFYGISKFPETMVVKKDGEVLKKVAGALDWTSPEITEYLDQLDRSL